MVAAPRLTPLAQPALIAAVLLALAGCGEDPRDPRFDTPEATIDTMLGAFGVADMSQEEVQRHMRSRERFDLGDEATYRACFVDFRGAESEGLAGYVFGTIAAGKDQLRIALVGDKAHVFPDPERRERYIVMLDTGDGFRISLRDSVPTDIRAALLEEHQRIDNRNRRAGALLD